MASFKYNRKSLIALGLTFVLAVSLSACGGGTGANSAAAKEVHIGYLNVMDDAQTILADQGGFYQKHGLKVTMQQFSSGTDLIKAIINGQLDAGVLGFTNALSWAAQGADLKVVGGAQMGYHSLMVKNGSNVKTVADLKGKKLASQKAGSTADVVLNGVILSSAGLDSKSVNMVYVEPAAAIQSLQAGTVDAAFVFEPYDHIARAAFDAQSIYEIGKAWPFPCMVVITSGDVWKNKHDAVNQMLDAQKEAIDLLKKDPAKAAGIISKNFIEGDSLDTPKGKVKAVDVIKDSIAAQTYNYDITPDQVKRMQEIADIMVKQGAMQKPIKVDDILDLSWQNSQKKS
jgi:NitT/TauT family transport system substrate-binding protein